MSVFHRRWEPESASLGSLAPLFGGKLLTSLANVADECTRVWFDSLFDESAGVNEASKWLGPYGRDQLRIE